MTIAIVARIYIRYCPILASQTSVCTVRLRPRPIYGIRDHIVIIDATPRPAVQPGQNWWSARSPKLQIRQEQGALAAPASADPLEYGLSLFHAGEVARALPLIGRAATTGNPKAQYLFATALFNGDGVARDWATAQGLMRLAYQGGIAEAGESLTMMAELIAPDDPPTTLRAPTDHAPLEPKRLVSPATAAAVATVFAALNKPEAESAAGTLEAVVHAMLVPMLQERLGEFLLAAVTRQVAAVMV